MNVNGSSAAKALSLFLIDMGNVQRLFFYEEVGASASKNPLFNYSNIIKIIRRKKMLITNFVEIFITPRTVTHYENKGYIIPLKFNKKTNKMVLDSSVKIKNKGI